MCDIHGHALIPTQRVKLDVMSILGMDSSSSSSSSSSSLYMASNSFHRPELFFSVSTHHPLPPSLFARTPICTLARVTPSRSLRLRAIPLTRRFHVHHARTCCLQSAAEAFDRYVAATFEDFGSGGAKSKQPPPPPPQQQQQHASSSATLQCATCPVCCFPVL